MLLQSMLQDGTRHGAAADTSPARGRCCSPMRPWSRQGHLLCSYATLFHVSDCRMGVRQGRGAWRNVGQQGAATGAGRDYAANIQTTDQTLGGQALGSQALGAAAAQQVTSLLAQQPGANAAATSPVNPSGTPGGATAAGASLVARATDNILGASTGSTAGATTAGGAPLLMPGRRLLREPPVPG